MEDELKSREEQARKIVEETEKDTNLATIEEMVKDNKIQLEYEGKQYRVRLLSLREKEELDTLRTKKFNSMLQEKDDKDNYVYLTERALIEILKKREEIDIDKLDDDVKKINIEEKDLQLKLGESISKNEPETILKTYKDQIKEIEIRKAIISTQKTLLLRFSLENQLLDYVARIITYLSSDVLEDGEWKRLFNNLEEFESFKDDKLVEMLGFRSMLLQYK